MSTSAPPSAVPLPPPSASLADASSAPPPLDSAAPSLSNTARDRARHRELRYGNYHNYYAHRAQSIPDARLALLPRALFDGKRVLDLGTNAGKLALECVQYLGAISAVGLDIDPELIERATEAGAGQNNVAFSCEDFMGEGHSWPTPVDDASKQFDTVLLLSITKWLHLNNGDDAMLHLFRRLYEALPLGGCLVVEPQEQANYRAAVRAFGKLRYMKAQCLPRDIFLLAGAQEQGPQAHVPDFEDGAAV